MNNSLLSILILVVPIMGVMMFARSKKKKRTEDEATTKNKSELWTVIKKFLKEENSVGKEIIDCFFQKRQGKEYKKRSVFVVIFQTKDTKTLQEDLPRALELEIVTKTVDNKQRREIVVNSEKDYNSEIGWVNEARKKELEREKKQEAKIKKSREKKEARLKIKKEKQEAKQIKKREKVN